MAGAGSPTVGFVVATKTGDEVVTRVFWGDPYRVVVRGLPAGVAVRLIARADIVDSEYVSEAAYHADSSGVVDVGVAAATNGSYQGVDADGLIWSMTAAPAADNKLPFNQLRVIAEVDGTEVGRGQLERFYLADGVKETPVSEGGLLGAFFMPPHQAGEKLPVIIAFGGSEGGLNSGRFTAMYYAALGYATLGVAYFGAPGLPSTLASVPLEYFETAHQWLAKRPGVDANRVGVTGGSRGGELALLLAATFPWVKAAVSELTSGVVWGALSGSGPAWTYQNVGLPDMPSALVQPTTSVDSDGMTLLHYRPTFEASMKLATPAQLDAATIKVENAQGPILMIGGSDDQLWPACDLAQPAWQRLVSSGHSKQYADELLCLQDAGHSDLRPGSPTVGGHRAYHSGLKQWLALGGTPEGVGRGQRLADTKTRAFFASALGNK